MKKVCGKGCVWWEKFGGQFLADGWPDGFCPCCGAKLAWVGDEVCEQFKQSRALHIEVSELDSRVTALENLSEGCRTGAFAKPATQEYPRTLEMGKAVMGVLRSAYPMPWSKYDFDAAASTLLPQPARRSIL